MKNSPKKNHPQTLDSIKNEKKSFESKQNKKSFTTDDIEDRKATFNIEEFKKNLEPLKKEQLDKLIKKFIQAKAHPVQECQTPEASQALDGINDENDLLEMPRVAFEFVCACALSAYERTSNLLWSLGNMMSYSSDEDQKLKNELAVIF